MSQKQPEFDLESVQKLLSGTLLWVILAVVVAVGFLAKTLRIEEVSGEQVGFLLNRITGELKPITSSGKQIFNGLTHEFYVLDKTVQTMEMTAVADRGDRREKDDLKVKTIDGSDVYVDLKVQFLIDANVADEVLKTSGPGDAYKTKWARDYVRAITRDHLGELTTEDFYDASKRGAKLIAAEMEANERLKAFGIRVDDIAIPRRPLFYKEYEDMIKLKKEADQTVHAEQSRAQAAKQKQQTMIVQETNKKNVAVEQFEGEMKQKIIAAGAQGELIRKGADAYYEQRTVAAEAELYGSKQQSEGILARKSAEAVGIMALKNAMEGDGGLNMVKLEYAKRLKNVQISGQPFTRQSHTERFEHLSAPATMGATKPAAGRSK